MSVTFVPLGLLSVVATGGNPGGGMVDISPDERGERDIIQHILHKCQSQECFRECI